MYLEIDEGFDSHPKTVRLCRVLSDVNAGQYLIRLWAWACRSAPDGDISGMEAADMEAITRYAPMDGKLFSALTEKWSPKFGPWIDVEGTSVRIHGWEERQGAAIARMSKRASDMRALRNRRKAERDSHVAVTLPNRDTYVGDQTRPDKTRQDQTRQEGDPARAHDPSSTTTNTDLKLDALAPTLCEVGKVLEIERSALANLTSMPVAKIRPRTADELIFCMKVAREAQPNSSMWGAEPLATMNADRFLRSLGDIEKALPEIEHKIAIFVADPDMQPWTVKKFCEKYNGIGMVKLEFGRAPKTTPEAHKRTPIMD